ncbi:hypothetical protein R1X32_02780 (plasmid) [Rhodococcus opacus]|uniref:hypothetical protein n=1 Tax=Rhodococcus opacus TaxID=37919 RepID=UPI002015F7B6
MTSTHAVWQQSGGDATTDAATTPPFGKILTADEVARFVARVAYPTSPAAADTAPDSGPGRVATISAWFPVAGAWGGRVRGMTLRLPTTLATDSDAAGGCGPDEVLRAARIWVKTPTSGRISIRGRAPVIGWGRRTGSPSIGKEAGLPEEISALRVFDVSTWVDGKDRGLGEPSDQGR